MGPTIYILSMHVHIHVQHEVSRPGMGPTSPGPSVTLMLTSPGPHVTLMLTSPGPYGALMLTLGPM